MHSTSNSITNNNNNHNHHYDDEDENDDDVIPTLVPIQTYHTENTNKISKNPTSSSTLTSTSPTTTTHPISNTIPSIPSSTNPAVGNSTTTTSTTNTTIPITKCPVTILSGYLGAGKSTLIQSILSSKQHQKRIAVIENEYGMSINTMNNKATTTSIESMILRNGMTIDNDNNDTTTTTTMTKPEFIDLPNGCVCCTVKDSLVITLERLLERESVSHANNNNTKDPKKQPIDYIIIECSGLANPGPIASIFWLDEALSSKLILDGIITMVDVTNIERQLQVTSSSTNNIHNEVIQQIAYADRILLNKIDLLSNENADVTITRVTNRIRQIHPTVWIHTTRYATISNLHWIFNTQCYNINQQQQQWLLLLVSSSKKERSKQSNSYFDDMAICAPCDTIGLDDTNSNNNSTNKKNTNDRNSGHMNNNVKTITVMVRGMVDVTKVHLYLATILWPNQDVSEHVVRTRMEQEQQQYPNTQPSSNKDEDVTTSRTSNSTDTSTQQEQQQQIFRIKGLLSVGVVKQSNTLDDVTNVRNTIDDENDEMTHLSRVIPTDIDSNHLHMYSDIRRHIVQGVYDLWDIHPCSHPDLFWTTNTTTNDDNDENENDKDHTVEMIIPIEERISQLIIIGRNLQKQNLQIGFDDCRLILN